MCTETVHSWKRTCMYFLFVYRRLCEWKKVLKEAPQEVNPLVSHLVMALAYIQCSSTHSACLRTAQAPHNAAFIQALNTPFFFFLILPKCGYDWPSPHSDLVSMLLMAETEKVHLQLALMFHGSCTFCRKDKLNRLLIQLEFVYFPALQVAKGDIVVPPWAIIQEKYCEGFIWHFSAYNYETLLWGMIIINATNGKTN